MKRAVDRYCVDKEWNVLDCSFFILGATFCSHKEQHFPESPILYGHSLELAKSKAVWDLRGGSETTAFTPWISRLEGKTDTC